MIFNSFFKRKISVLFGFFVVFAFIKAHAESGETYTLDNIKNSQIEVDCSNVDLKLTQEPTAQMKITTQLMEGQKATSSSDWRVSVAHDAIRNLYKLTCIYPERAALNKKLLQEYRFIITMKGPSSRDLSVHSRYGKVAIIGWTQAAHVVVENGSIELKNTSGSFNVNVVQGSIDVEKHNGRLHVDLFQGKLNLNQVDGNLDLTNFNGNSLLKSINGDIVFNSRNGSLELMSSQGTFKFDSDLGKIDITNFNGAIDGNSDQAQVTAKLSNPARFHAKVKNATVKLSVPSDSGAQIYLALNEGQFQVPGYLSQDNYGAVKTAKGTLRGGETGRISVTGDSGKVILSTF